MKSKKRHGKVSRRKFVSTAGSCTAAAVGLGSALTACVDTLNGPPDPDTEQYRVTSSDNAPVAGSAVTITAQLVDANDNPVSRAGLTVTWTSTGGGSFATPTSLTDANGEATVVFTTNQAANTDHTVTATDDSSPTPLTGTSAVFTTQASTATQYRVTSSDNAPVAGSAVTITAQLVDANDNPVSTAGLTVTWTSTGGGGSFATPTSLTDANGEATVVFTTTQAANTDHTVTATDDSSPTPSTGTSAVFTTQGAGTATVVFSSLWLTATGTSDAARRDTSNPVANGGPFLGNTESAHTVVSGASFNWPHGNCLQIEQGMGVGTPGSAFIGDAYNINSVIPANTDYYFRIYVNVWDIYLNRYGSRHPVNTSHFIPQLTLWSCKDATPDKSLYRPGLMRAYTLNGGSQGNPDVTSWHGGFWWPGKYPVGNSPVISADFWLPQQHWYLFEAHIHYLDVALQRYFFGSYGVYDAEDNYTQIADLSNYQHEGSNLEQARLDGAFNYKGYLASSDPNDIVVYPYTGVTYPWQIMIGTEGNAAQVNTFPHERHLYAAPAVATGGFPPRLAAL
jgi:hypothetical protein